jgi:hypothetical protein
MPSATYKLFREAMFAEKQVHCFYDGHVRVLCPVILGHSDGEEKLLAYQVGGTGSRGLPRAGQWKCLRLLRVKDPKLRDGPWREGERHRQEQSCVQKSEQQK